jgi:SAM-dependent methyltransferase
LHFRDNKSLESVEQINLIDNDFENKYQKLLKSFDSVFALNVVEHIEDDNQAINNFRKLLKERGTGIILVPSYQWSVGTLCKHIGFSIDKLLNFNAAGVFGWFLFGKILQGKQFKNNQMNIYNKLVSIFMQIEKLLFQTFGLSLILIGRKQLWGKCFQ